MDPEVMHGTGAFTPGGLIIKADQAGADLNHDIAPAGHDLVENDLGTEHLPVEPKARIKVGRKKMNMM